ncbi:MAG: glycoside hydrolase family 97 protein [Bryobacteraceae bacterium]
MNIPKLFLGVLTVSVPVLLGADGAARVASPDGRILFELMPGDQLDYRVSFRGKPVIDPSALGFDLQNQQPLGAHLKLTAALPTSGDETYTMPHGKSNPVRNHYNSLIAELEETARPERRLNVEVRAYDDGVAFRYIIPEQTALREIRIIREKTQFELAKDADTWPLVLANYRTPYEANYEHVPLSGIVPNWLVALPFLAELPGTAFVAISEAQIENYPGMYLAHAAARSGRVMEARLAPRADEPELAATGITPLRTPWRVVMIGTEAGRLIESNIVINLNPPSAIADTSWIKPGKAAWDWWSGSFARDVDFKPGMNTATMKHYIDFAAGARLEYMLIDAGWAPDAKEFMHDITRTIPEIDMPGILSYARSKGVKVWLWAHWTSVDRQMDEAFPMFEKWGVAGVKIDFMDRDDQWMVDWYHRVLRTAAQHHLMIDYHGAYKPDGTRRTWPNLMTREGVMGLEYSKWSGRVTPAHNVILAYTRMLAGPMDYTPGGFRNVTREDFTPRNLEPTVMGTRAHQLALFVVFESAFEMVADHPEAYKGQKELPFLSAVPTIWDETRVLNGKVGEWITIARRRAKEWYIGSITDWTARELDVPLDFLGSGDYIAEIYADGPDAATSPTHTAVEQQRVRSGSKLHLKLVTGGGCAIRIRPA